MSRRGWACPALVPLHRQTTRAGQAQPLRDAQNVCQKNKNLRDCIAEVFASEAEFLCGPFSLHRNEQVEISILRAAEGAAGKRVPLMRYPACFFIKHFARDVGGGLPSPHG